MNKDEREKLSNHKFVSVRVKMGWFSGKTLDIKVRQAPFVWFVILSILLVLTTCRYHASDENAVSSPMAETVSHSQRKRTAFACARDLLKNGVHAVFQLRVFAEQKLAA
jgi:hypothetical protein